MIIPKTTKDVATESLGSYRKAIGMSSFILIYTIMPATIAKTIAKERLVSPYRAKYPTRAPSGSDMPDIVAQKNAFALEPVE